MLTRVAALIALALPASALAAEKPWDGAAAGFRRMMSAEGRIVLHLGEQMVVRFDADGVPMVQSVVPAERQDLSADQRATADAMTFTLGRDEQAGWILKVANGSGRAMAYGAMIAIPHGDSLALAPTSTCTVAGHTYGLETWPNEVVMVALGPFLPREPGAAGCETLATPPAGADDPPQQSL